MKPCPGSGRYAGSTVSTGGSSHGGEPRGTRHTGGGGPSKEGGRATADWTLPDGTGHAHRSEEKLHWYHITHCTKAASEGRPEGRRGEKTIMAKPCRPQRTPKKKTWSLAIGGPKKTKEDLQQLMHSSTSSSGWLGDDLFLANIFSGIHQKRRRHVQTLHLSPDLFHLLRFHLLPPAE
ncbi:hypothetical protein EYF80_006203 [Liparis tanakae]|uniref:Uncharacterized protein n=1 Tax=Liparis tanakae TaxID=230148 RepID=A0A4Z2J028_9TELE|nr:hypothetical protein EYF80_006203 [Liparis tanakae]